MDIIYFGMWRQVKPANHNVMVCCAIVVGIEGDSHLILCRLIFARTRTNVLGFVITKNISEVELDSFYLYLFNF